MTGEEARARFAQARVARLATADAGGQPHAVPIVFALDGEHVYSVVDSKPKRTLNLRRLRNLAENPRAAVLVDHYAESWDELWWVRADGAARVLEPVVPEALHAVALLAARYPQQRSAGPVIAVDVGHWSYWEAAS